MKIAGTETFSVDAKTSCQMTLRWRCQAVHSRSLQTTTGEAQLPVVKS